jgi:hypothetical protein
VLGLRRLALGERNTVAGPTYRESGDPPVAASATPFTVTWDDAKKMAPGAWTPAQTNGFIAAARDIAQAEVYAAVELMNLVARPAPSEEHALDAGALRALWGPSYKADVQAVNALLTKVRSHSEENYLALEPYAQRDVHTANLLRRVATGRQAPSRLEEPASAPPPARSAEPAAEPRDTWPFRWTSDER